MAPISSQNAETTALPLTEQITYLCDYCINLIRAMVKFEEMSDKSILERAHICPEDPGPEICRLCKVLTEQLSTQKQHLTTEGPDLKPTDWKKADLWMFQTYNGGERLYKTFSVKPRRLCGVKIHRAKYAIWADKGDSDYSLLVALLTVKPRKSGKCISD